MEKNTRIVYINMDGEVGVRNVSPEYKSLQDLVGGLIEIPFISHKFTKNDIDIIINEEGKLLSLTPQIAIMERGKIVDIICGPVVFIGFEGETGNSVSLTYDQIEFLQTEIFNGRRAIVQLGDENYELFIIEL